MMIDVPAQPDEGLLPTPEVDQPAQPDEGPQGLPTPSLPSQPQPVPSPRLCPLGYQSAVVQNGQTFSDLLLLHDVSWQAMRAANPSLSTSRLSPGTRYCVPPRQTRRVCPSGSSSYVMGQYEDLSTLTELFSLPPALFLAVNPQLAPSDFTAGRVVCIP